MLFSQRIGKCPTEKIAQKDTIDEDLKNSLWNALTIFYWDRFGSNRLLSTVEHSNLKPLLYRIWLHFFKQPIDTIDEDLGTTVKHLRSFFCQAEWYEVYDFIEFIALNGPDDCKEDFTEVTNEYLERENSAYRFVNGYLAEITSEAEIDAVESAIEQSYPYFGARKHLQTALMLLSNKENPDYRNSIKESISAVESLAKAVTGEEKATGASHFR